MADLPEPNCASCPIDIPGRACRSSDGTGPGGCPTLEREDIAERAAEILKSPEILKMALESSLQEASCYAGREGEGPVRAMKPRVQEVWEFCGRMGYKKIGLVFCVGLAREAEKVEALLEAHGLDVVSAICKIGRVPKESIGVQDGQKIRPGTDEAMCNPVAQAIALNDAGTDFNVVLGLCVGHDSLFIKHSEAPVTVLAVKDRVTGHNPLAAVYLGESYFAWLKSGEIPNYDVK